jgi:glutamate---cysteine ligase / carboxylate-amine ligase
MPCAPSRLDREVDMSWLFARSPAHTLGVELEVGIVSDATGELTCAAPQVLAALDPDLFGVEPTRIKREFFESTLEMTTGVCRTPAHAKEDLAAALAALDPVLGALGLSLIAAGAHPFSRWQEQAVTRDARYLQIVERFRWPVRQLTTYGLHVHVGVPTGDHAIAAMNALTGLLPHFLALSASSPFWQGADTGLASARSRLWGSVPSSGLPPHLRDWHDFEQFADLMVGSGTIQTPRDLWWDVRPSPLLGTVELRICDSAPTLTEMCALAAFAQAAVSLACERFDAGEELPRDPDWLVQENKWRAGRNGLGATLVRGDGTVVPVVEAVLEWVELVGHQARQLGGETELAGVLAILDHGPSAARQRDLVGRGGSLRDVVDVLSGELATDRIGG